MKKLVSFNKLLAPFFMPKTIGLTLMKQYADKLTQLFPITSSHVTFEKVLDLPQGVTDSSVIPAGIQRSVKQREAPFR